MNEVQLLAFALNTFIDEQIIAAHRRGSDRPFSGSPDSAIEALEKVKAELKTLVGDEQEPGKHPYPAGYEPPDGPLRSAYGNDAWGILDIVSPGVIPLGIRYLLAGLIAGRIQTRVGEVMRGVPQPQVGIGRRKIETPTQ